jgi:CBS domain-containing protein
MPGHARTIMTPRVTAVSPDTPLPDIVRILAAGGFGGVPVTDGTGRVVGFVSEGDLMDALLRGSVERMRAGDVMSSPVITVDEFDTAEDVMQVLRGHGIHHVPVVRHEKLVGIITPSDVIRFFAEDLPEPPEAG